MRLKERNLCFGSSKLLKERRKYVGNTCIFYATMEKVEKVINVSRVILILNMEELYDPKKSALIIPVSQK